MAIVLSIFSMLNVFSLSPHSNVLMILSSYLVMVKSLVMLFLIRMLVLK